MSALRLVYFDGCPNAEAVRAALRNAGHPWDEVRQDDLPDGDPLHGYTSPTVLLGQDVLFGIATSDGQSGCSVQPLEPAELEQAIRTALG